jgi:anti-sigma factor RsiW
MYQHPTEQQLTEYKKRTLAPDAFLVVHGHVSECARCAARCYEPSQVRTDYDTLLVALTPAADELPFHLTDGTVAGYVADELDEIDRETAVTHLEVCTECAATVARLRAVQEDSAPVAANPTATPPATADAPIPVRNNRWQLWPLRLSRAIPMQLAAIVLILAALLGAVWFLLKARNARTPKLVRDDIPTASANEGQPFDKNETPTPSPESEPAREQPERIVLALNDAGQQVTLDTQGNLAGLEQLPERVRMQIKSALATRRLARPSSINELDRQTGTLRGAGKRNGLPFGLLAPLGVVVESARPTFRWQPLAGADAYNVTVTDDQLNEVATSGPLTATSWRAPQSLARGAIYSWQVTAHKKGGQSVTSPAPPAPQAKFQVLAQTRLTELRHARRLYPNSHLALGVLYAQAGLLDDAAREFQTLARDNPQADVARKLLQDVRSFSARRRSG